MAYTLCYSLIVVVSVLSNSLLACSLSEGFLTDKCTVWLVLMRWGEDFCKIDLTTAYLPRSEFSPQHYIWVAELQAVIDILVCWMPTECLSLKGATVLDKLFYINGVRMYQKGAWWTRGSMTAFQAYEGKRCHSLLFIGAVKMSMKPLY